MILIFLSYIVNWRFELKECSEDCKGIKINLPFDGWQKQDLLQLCVCPCELQMCNGSPDKNRDQKCEAKDFFFFVHRHFLVYSMSVFICQCF